MGRIVCFLIDQVKSFLAVNLVSRFSGFMLVFFFRRVIFVFKFTWGFFVLFFLVMDEKIVQGRSFVEVVRDVLVVVGKRKKDVILVDLLFFLVVYLRILVFGFFFSFMVFRVRKERKFKICQSRSRVGEGQRLFCKDRVLRFLDMGFRGGKDGDIFFLQVFGQVFVGREWELKKVISFFLGERGNF